MAGVAAVAARNSTRFSDLQPSGKFVEVDGTRLHYRILGKDGPQVLAIHGASGNILDWIVGPAQAIAENHRLLLIDRPGLGYSDRAPQDGSNPFVQARLMRRAETQLGFDAPILIGHSYGGAVALAWALDAPEVVPGLMLLAAPSHVWDGPPSLRNRRLASTPVLGQLATHLAAATVPQSMIDAAIDDVFAPQTPPPDYANRIEARLVLRPATQQANATDIATLKPHIRAMVPRYDSLTMPIELLHGDADTTVGLSIHSEPFAQRLPNAHLTVLDGIGHMPHHARPNEVLAALNRLTANRKG
ncbi:alpha/beta fold hydrolase [Halovulum sp. GXIMD14793]